MGQETVVEKEPCTVLYCLQLHLSSVFLSTGNYRAKFSAVVPTTYCVFISLATL